MVVIWAWRQVGGVLRVDSDVCTQRWLEMYKLQRYMH